jgi:hypothetical protein
MQANDTAGASSEIDAKDEHSATLPVGTSGGSGPRPAAATGGHIHRVGYVRRLHHSAGCMRGIESERGGQRRSMGVDMSRDLTRSTLLFSPLDRTVGIRYIVYTPQHRHSDEDLVPGEVSYYSSPPGERRSTAPIHSLGPWVCIHNILNIIVVISSAQDHS